MILFPTIAAIIALVCAGVTGRDAMRRPRPERVIWTIAFLLFAVAAGTEVAGATTGWTPILARLYYLAGAVLVVGLLALGEVYLLAGKRVPAIAPGVVLLVVAVAATAVWSAPLDADAVMDQGWRAIERGPFLIALAASINAGGTVVLAGGALYSAKSALRHPNGSKDRAMGCVLIAIGAVVVASGGTLTRLGDDSFLYVAMATGIITIFSGILLTRRTTIRQSAGREVTPNPAIVESSSRARLVSLPLRRVVVGSSSRADDGVAFIVDRFLALDAEQVRTLCLQWSATPLMGEQLTRPRAHQVWALRRALPPDARPAFDRLPMDARAQLAELYEEVWSTSAEVNRGEQGA